MTKLGLFLLRQRSADAAAQLARFDEYISALATWWGREGDGPVAAPGKGHEPTEVDSRGRILCRYGPCTAEASDAIKRYWPESVWSDAAAVSHEESIGWRNDAVLDTRARGGGACGVRYWFSDEVGWATTELSVGLFQINVCAHGGSRSHWENPDNNARKGAELYRESGWRPWTVTSRRLGLL